MTTDDDRDFARFRATGDAGALAALFDRCAPSLLLLASHWTRDAATAEDLVQTVFVHAVRDASQWDERQPVRRWLGGILAHRAIDIRRRNALRDSPRPLADLPGREPSPLAAAIDREALERIAAAIDGIDEPYRDVLVLRVVHGLEPAAIAHALGRAPATVRKQLERGLQRLRGLLPAALGLSLATALEAARGLVAVRTAVLSSATAKTSSTAGVGLLGVLAMKKLLLLVASLAAVLTWWSWRDDAAPSSPPDGARAGVGVAAAGASAQEPSRRVEPVADSREPVVVATAPRDARGVLEVRVRYANEPAIAAGVFVSMLPDGADARLDVRRTQSDEVGLARFEGVPPGKVQAWVSIRPNSGSNVVVVDGQTAVCDVTLRDGMTLRGEVVDPDGVPVAGAIVEASLGGGSSIEAERIATSGSDGRFVVRECDPICLIGARAANFAASQLLFRMGEPGGEQDVRIELRRDGGVVEGVVVDDRGAPIAGAVVRVGEGRTEAIRSTPQGAEPLPAQVRTAADGTFRAIGVPAGSQPLQVRDAVHAPWRGTCEVLAGGVKSVRVALQPGCTVVGTVRDEQGTAVAGAGVWAGTRGDFVTYQTTSRSDGSFQFDGVDPAGVTLEALERGVGQAESRVAGRPGEQLHCVLVLSYGLALRGRVVIGDGQRAPEQMRVSLRSESPDRPWSSGADMRADGSFVVPDCPADTTFTLSILAKGCAPFERGGLRPGGEPLLVSLQPDTAPKVRIVGRLLRPDGTPAAGESIDANCPAVRASTSAPVEVDGSFTLEVGAGAWRLRVLVKGHPEVRVSSRDLQAGEQWNVGTLQLTVGGTLVLDEEAGEAKLDFLVLDPAGQFVCGLYSPVPPLRSDLLAPGEYRLMVKGEGVAAQALPFVVRAGEETVLEVKRSVGVLQRFALVTDAPATGRVQFEIRRGGELLQRVTPRRVEDGFEHSVWLLPGEYELSWPGHEARQTFTVGAEAAAPLRVQVPLAVVEGR